MSNHKATSSIQRAVDAEYQRYHAMDSETFQKNSLMAPAPGKAQLPDRIRAFPLDPSIDYAVLRDAADAHKTPEEHRAAYISTLHNSNPTWKGPAVRYAPVPIIKQKKPSKVMEIIKKFGCFGAEE